MNLWLYTTFFGVGALPCVWILTRTIARAWFAEKEQHINRVEKAHFGAADGR